MPLQPRRFLPRLAPEMYCGNAVVFWTHTVKDRASGWLDPSSHAAFREIVLHAAIREQLLCPVYTMMPDHVHFVWMGVAPESDQLSGSVFFRRQFERNLAPWKWQSQPHDHVLREDERLQGSFMATCTYIHENPVRKRLVANRESWPFSGCVLPGYPEMLPNGEGFWELFWRIYNHAVERQSIGKLDVIRRR